MNMYHNYKVYLVFIRVLTAVLALLALYAPAELVAEQLKPTEEQRIIMKEKLLLPQPTDAPVPLYDRDLGVVGKPNPRFGEISLKFLEKHEARMKLKNPSVDLVFLGDSITAGWTGAGGAVWKEYFSKYNPVNLGIGGEKTQNLLWHLEHGYLDGIDPKVVVLMIGTNNLAHHSNDDIVKGVTRIVSVIYEKLPETQVLLLGIFPRGHDPKEERVRQVRERIRNINETLSQLDDGTQTRYLDLSANFLTEDGHLPRETVPDTLHPNRKGYQVWGAGMSSLLDEMMCLDVPKNEM